MTKKIAPPVKAWTKPQLERLGKIADVAGNSNVSNNGVSPNLQS